MNLSQAIEEFSESDKVHVVLDFDGTLAPIVDRPDDAAADDRASRALARLAGLPNVDVVILSGRGLADLAERVGDVPGVRLVGGHGSETDTRAEPDDLSEINDRFADVVARLPGAWVEVKNHSLGLHYRAVDSDRLEDELAELRRWSRTRDDLHVLENKRIFEMGIRPLSKGVAINQIRSTAPGSPVLYAGDDLTDEKVFDVLGEGDIGVKVGEGETAARFRVSNVAEMIDVIEDLVAVFAGRVGRLA